MQHMGNRTSPTATNIATGFGLRVPHYQELLERGARADLVEVISENFIRRGGRPRALLERVRRDMPVVLHGVSLNIGGNDALNWDYLKGLRELRTSCEAAWISDHLCVGGAHGHYAHDLWPMPRTAAAVAHIAERVRQVQDFLGERIALENISAYVRFAGDELSEGEFIAAVLREADCDLMLDINNLVVNQRNHGEDPMAVLASIQSVGEGRVRQMHLAGHLDCGTHALDDHGAPVSDRVWELYASALKLLGPVPTIIEWDERIPSLERLEAEADDARRRGMNAIHERAQRNASANPRLAAQPLALTLNRSVELHP